MQTKFLSLLALLALVPLAFDDAFATANYYGAYPDVAKRDASYVYLTVDMTGVTSSVTSDVIGLASAAHATSGDVLTGYVSQVMILYDDSESDIELHSEVYGLDSDLALHVPYDCEIETLGCQDLGTATTIVDMAAQAYWFGGDVIFFVDVDYTGATPSDWFVNDDYDPDGNAEESPTQFQSGRTTFDSKLFKHVQWAVESPNNADTWTIKIDGMVTWASSTGSKTFANDLAKTTEYFEDDTDASYITYRIEGQSYQVLKVGEGDHCVTRNGNTDGIIEFVEASSGCLAAGSTLWS